jgi:fibronectin type 3 domain-containing protein
LVKKVQVLKLSSIVKRAIAFCLLFALIVACGGGPDPGPSRPDAPTNLNAEAGDGEVELSWNSSEGALGYNVYRSETQNVEVNADNRQNDTLIQATTFTDANVENGQTYHYVVTAVGDGGESAASDEVEATPEAQVVAPDAPQGLEAEAGDGEVVLSWEESDGASGYHVYRSETPGVEVNPANRRNATLLQATEFTDDQVNNDTIYYYVVTAVGPGGESAASSEVEATPGTALPPAAPTGLQAQASAGQVSLSWNPSEGATDYNVYRSETSPVDLGAEPIATVGATSYLDENVVNGTTYHYVVTAVNEDGESAASAEVSATPEGDIAPPPPPPTNVVAVPGVDFIEISWNPSAGAASYNVYRGNTPSLTIGAETLVATVTQASYRDEDVAVGATYYYAVTAADASGNASAASEVVSATPPEPGNAIIEIGNLAGMVGGELQPGFFNDWFVFSNIQNVPTTNEFPTWVNLELNGVATMRVRNAAAEDDLVVSSFHFEGLHAQQFTIRAQENPGFSLPLVIAPGEFVDLQIKFLGGPSDPNDTSQNYAHFCPQWRRDNGTCGEVRRATLIIGSNAETPSTAVQLAGTHMFIPEHTREVSLTQLAEVFGYSIDVGEPLLEDDVELKGEEIRSRLWTKANPDEPVYVRQLAAFHSCCNSADWFDLGSGTHRFHHHPHYSHTVLPTLRENPDEPAQHLYTDLPDAFPIRVANNRYTTDTDGALAIRMWPISDRHGERVENAYFIAQDYVDVVPTGCGDGEAAANCDYNDNVFLITNVAPVSGD